MKTIRKAGSVVRAHKATRLNKIKKSYSLSPAIAHKVKIVGNKEGLNESEAIERAAELWLDTRNVKEMERSYVLGYNRIPERASEHEPFHEAQRKTMSREAW